MNTTNSWVSTLLALTALGQSVAASPIGVIDDFSDANLSEYVQTLVLDQNATSDIGFVATGGALQVTKTFGLEAEQVLFLRDDHHLDVGQTLRVDLDWQTTTRADIGIVVAATKTPTAAVWTSGTADSRENYVTVYAQADVNNIKSLGIAGNTVPPTVFANAIPLSTKVGVTGLYIHRPTLHQFVTGYTTLADGDTNFATWTNTNPAMGSAVGFFADVRTVTTYGNLDNLRIVPEPATGLLTLLAVTFVAAQPHRRRALRK
jgi:hypothetical protein